MWVVRKFEMDFERMLSRGLGGVLLFSLEDLKHRSGWWWWGFWWVCSKGGRYAEVRRRRCRQVQRGVGLSCMSCYQKDHLFWKAPFCVWEEWGRWQAREETGLLWRDSKGYRNMCYFRAGKEAGQERGLMLCVGASTSIIWWVLHHIQI